MVTPPSFARLRVARRLLRARRHLRQLHIGGCFKFFFGNALEQVFLLVDASLNLVFVERGVGGFGNLAYRGLSLFGILIELVLLENLIRIGKVFRFFGSLLR